MSLKAFLNVTNICLWCGIHKTSYDELTNIFKTWVA